jgi:3-mercaptopyruvate sulfurtransferase SseA
MYKLMKRSLLIMIVVIGVMQFIVSCGSDDYEKPATTETGTALISADTLKSWMDAGKVNGTGYDRVVILDVTSYGTYTNGHIPGALFVDSTDIGQSRTEGIAMTTTEVPEGSKMDELIQKNGIDANTTIIFTGSSLMSPTRAYFTFRYWGFPKNRLKVLDGVNASYTPLTPGLPPVVARSSYSVKNNKVLRSDLRVSLSEMIDYADGKIPNAVPVDVRSSTTSGSYAGIRGSTTGVFAPAGPPSSLNDYAVFEGRIRGALAHQASSLSTANVFKPVDQLIASFTSIGLDSSRTAYLYCKVGQQSSATFFVLDGILGWPAAIYDGSWNQWGQLSGNTSMKGQLDPNSPWRTDIPGRSDVIVYNQPLLSAVTFTGAGTVNDLTSGGTFTGTADKNFIIEIDGDGTPNTFRWGIYSGTTTTWKGSAISITAATAQPLSEGVTVTFAADTGHTSGDSWTFTAPARKNVEQLTADGTICSARYNVDGSITDSSGGTEACTNAPTSFDVNVNRVEEADELYMNSGGGSGGSGDGGAAVPAGC